MRSIILMIALVSLCACGSAADSTDLLLAEESAAVSGGSADKEIETSTDEPVQPLAGTSWQLVEFQSMSDEQGTAVPQNPSDYTVSFIDDGTVAIKLNCNLGKGSWSSIPAVDGQSGSISIGPLTVTRALCPPPSLDQKIASDMGYVHGYLLRDNMLSLSLMADGSIYLWEPLSETDE